MTRIAPRPRPELAEFEPVFQFLEAEMGFWNDTLATPLEEEPLHVAQTYLASRGWEPGKHARRS